jgi:hypothetical protein
MRPAIQSKINGAAVYQKMVGRPQFYQRQFIFKNCCFIQLFIYIFSLRLFINQVPLLKKKIAVSLS